MTNTMIIMNFRQRALAALQAELTELGREAWRISQRERTIRDEMTALEDMDED